MLPLAGIYHAFDAPFAEKLITKGWIEKWVIEAGYATLSPTRG
ncbi:MAG: hypothetical protein ABSG88_24385 [Bradyrhizobium sp.]